MTYKLHKMNTITAYLTFNGNCREAMTFYKECLGGELNMQAVQDSPMAAQMPAAAQAKILHASLVSNGIEFLATDMIGPSGFAGGNNIALCLNCGSEHDTRKFFKNLADGGQVLHPLEDTFWSALFGMLTDKFGINWMFNYDKNANDNN